MRQRVESCRYRLEPAIARTVERRAKRFEQLLTAFSPGERKVLIELSRIPGTASLQGKDFFARTGLSPTAAENAQKLLETDAVIQVIERKFFVADPLLAAYLCNFK